MYLKQALKLPKQSFRIQTNNKNQWNQTRSKQDSDFYTLGYERREFNDLINLVMAARVSTVIDIRFTPVSLYNPRFNKGNLSRILSEKGIEYIHRADLGIPRDVRGTIIKKNSREELWAWYDKNVIPNFAGYNLDNFFNNANHPVVFMCMEYDPTSCHRHRLALALEAKGLRSYDL